MSTLDNKVIFIVPPPQVRRAITSYTLQEKDFSVGRQSFADKRREMIPALRDLYQPPVSCRFMVS